MKNLYAPLSLSILLLGCGGGGSDNPQNPNNPQNPSDPVSSVKFNVSGGKSLLTVDSNLYLTNKVLSTSSTNSEAAVNFFTMDHNGDIHPAVEFDHPVKFSYSVKSPDGKFIYAVVDAEDPWYSEQFLAETNCGIVKINVGNNASSCLVSGFLASEPYDYYNQINDGRFKPLQIDEAGNVYFIAQSFEVDSSEDGYKWLSDVNWNGVLSQFSHSDNRLKTIASDTDSISSFIVTPDNSLVYRANKLRMIPDLSAENLSTINLETDSWSNNWYTIDSYDTVIYSSTSGNNELVFAQPSETYVNAVEKAEIPTNSNHNWLNSIVVADDGYIYGVFDDSRSIDDEYVNIQTLKRVLPYAESEVLSYQVSDEQQYNYQTSMQISLGYAYYVEEQRDANFGERDVIRATRIVDGTSLTMLEGEGNDLKEQFSNMRVKIHTWKLADGIIFFTGFDQVSSTMVSGEIDTQLLKSGGEESEYLTYMEIASVADEAVRIDDMVVLGPQKPENSGGTPEVTRFVQHEDDLYSGTIEFNKWMNMESLKKNITLNNANSGEEHSLFLTSVGRVVHAIYDTNSGRDKNQPLQMETRYTLTVDSSAKDIDGYEIYDSNQPSGELSNTFESRIKKGLKLTNSEEHNGLFEGQFLKAYNGTVNFEALCADHWNSCSEDLDSNRRNLTNLNHSLSFDVGTKENFNTSLQTAYGSNYISIYYEHWDQKLTIHTYPNNGEEDKIIYLPENSSQFKVTIDAETTGTEVHMNISMVNQDKEKIESEAIIPASNDEPTYNWSVSVNANEHEGGINYLDNIKFTDKAKPLSLVDENFNNIQPEQLVSTIESIGLTFH